jgi:hypothetical protein
MVQKYRLRSEKWNPLFGFYVTLFEFKLLVLAICIAIAIVFAAVFYFFTAIAAVTG